MFFLFILLIGFVILALFLVAGSALLLFHLLQKNERVVKKLTDRLEREDDRAYSIGQIGLERELSAIREGVERERYLMSEGLERERAMFDRLLDKKNIAPLGSVVKEAPAPLKQFWNERDMALYRSWANEEKFVAVQTGQPDPSDEVLEKSYRMQFGLASPSEVFGG